MKNKKSHLHRLSDTLDPEGFFKKQGFSTGSLLLGRF